MSSRSSPRLVRTVIAFSSHQFAIRSYVNEVAPAAYQQLKDWVAEDSESHKRMLALHEKLVDEQERLTVLDAFEDH